MTVIRLEPPIYLTTPLGPAECHFYEVPDGWETHSIWHCFQLETHEAWDWPNPMVRLAESVTGMRGHARSPFVLTDAYFEELRPHILRHTQSPLHGKVKYGRTRS